MDRQEAGVLSEISTIALIYWCSVLQEIADTFKPRSYDKGHGKKCDTRNCNPYRLRCCHPVSNATRKNSPDETVLRFQQLPTRITRSQLDQTRLGSGHPELLVTTFFPHVLFSPLSFFASVPSLIVICVFPGFPSTPATATAFLFTVSFLSSLRSPLFFCPIAMYIFSVQSRPALMLSKALFSLSPFLYPASIERESHLKSALLSPDIYRTTFRLSTCARTIERGIKYFSVQLSRLPTSPSFVDSSFSL